MAKKESSQQASEQQEGKVDRIDNALQKFSDMLIARMEQMKESKWKKANGRKVGRMGAQPSSACLRISWVVLIQAAMLSCAKSTPRWSITECQFTLPSNR